MDKKNLKAVALRYEKFKDIAPKVVAKGKGEVAEKIIEIAKKHNIPIKKDEDLAEILSKLELYEEIPEELYEVVAEILAFVYEVTGKKDERLY